MTRTTSVPLGHWLGSQMRDAAFRVAFESLEPAYQVARLRILRGMTQQQLAEKVGTQQPSIARIESGRRKPSVDMLERIAAALDADLQVTLRPR